MANYNKQFNFRNGVQVDDDNLVVSPTGLVGIGTTVPIESLDVRGNASITGFATAASLYSKFLEVDGTAGVTTVTFTDAIGAGVSISSGIVTSSGTGIVTFYGDARFLQGMPTSQWLDIDAGLGYTSIYAQGNVGISTDDPRFTFQIGGTADNTEAGFKGNSLGGVGISSGGDVLITGITTAQKFVGIGSDLTFLDADNITSGTLTVERLPIIPDENLYPNLNLGIVTTTSLDTGAITGSNADLTGDVVIGAGLTVVNEIIGTASTARGLTGSPDIVVGQLTANAVSASSFVGGITGDVTGNLTGNVTGNVVGILTGNVTGDVTGTATTATALTSTADVDIADLQVGIATVTNFATVENFIGIGTDFTSNSLTITKELAAKVQVTSETKEAIIAIGRSQTINGTGNGAIRYGNDNVGFNYSTPNSLDFINYGDGNINTYLQAGSSGLGTGSIYWHNRSDVILSLTYEGRLGIGATLPEVPLHVVGDARVTGDGTFNGNLTVDGTLSAGTFSLPDSINTNVEGNLTGNVDAQSGLSTFTNIKSSFIGIGTDATDNDLPEVLSINSPGSGRFFVDQAGNVGVGTTAILIQGINAQEQDALIRGVGIGTTRPKCAVDFSNADNVDILGANRDRIAYMIPPRITTSQRNLLTNVDNSGVETGAFIYNTSLNKLQFWNGSSWETVTST